MARLMTNWVCAGGNWDLGWATKAGIRCPLVERDVPELVVHPGTRIIDDYILVCDEDTVTIMDSDFGLVHEIVIDDAELLMAPVGLDDGTFALVMDDRLEIRSTGDWDTVLCIQNTQGRDFNNGEPSKDHSTDFSGGIVALSKDSMVTSSQHGILRWFDRQSAELMDLIPPDQGRYDGGSVPGHVTFSTSEQEDRVQLLDIKNKHSVMNWDRDSIYSRGILRHQNQFVNYGKRLEVLDLMSGDVYITKEYSEGEYGVSACILGDHLFVMLNTHIEAYDCRSWDKLWSAPPPCRSAFNRLLCTGTYITAAGDTVFASCTDLTFWAYDVHTGAVKWQSPECEFAIEEPAITDNRILFTVMGELKCFESQ